jgi:membrane protein implicated in regulation of membrane protease activity
MNKLSSLIALFFASLFLVLVISPPVLAYVGPGAGLAAIGAFFALLVGIIAALFGFLWYPVKRMLRQRKQAQENENNDSNQDSQEEA